MFTSDLYLGSFLILCGFALSLFNLQRVVKRGTLFSPVLLSENIILMCIGIAFASRWMYSLNPINVEDFDAERAVDLASIATKDGNCGFSKLLLGYGPLVVSMVNSFLTLIIDNYMHFKILGSLKEISDENIVREIGEDNNYERRFQSSVCKIWKKYFSFLTIAMQWVVPTFTALAMYMIDVKEISMAQARINDASCMAMLDIIPDECTATNATNYTMDLSNYIQSPVNFFESQDGITTDNDQVDTVLHNVLRIINNFNNNTNFTYANIKSLRQPKTDEYCMKMCYTDNKNILTYMLILGFVSYFVPITLSTIILTRIHVMAVTKPKTKLHVTRELMCNILFWTPVMFDTLLSLILCAHTMHGMRTSMFNVIANIYQAVNNFMNTKYFNENAIIPVSDM